MHFLNSLKTNIAISLAILLLVAMLFVDFIMVMTAQKDFIRNELRKGHLFASLVKKHHQPPTGTHFLGLQKDFKKHLPGFLEDFNISGALILDKNATILHQTEFEKNVLKELKKMIMHSAREDEEAIHLTGSTWGVFWRQRQTLSMAIPLKVEGKAIGGIGLVVNLDKFYSDLRDSQQLVLFYIAMNTLILTCIGFYRMHKLSIKPIHRLVKRASEYSDKESFVFKYEKEKNEFGHLSRALNSMLLRISEDRDKLQASLESLEKTNFQLKKARNEIVRAEKLASVGRLSAGIAHEIGNPIGIVLGYLELLKKETVSHDEKKNFIDRAVNEIARINVIIRQLLDFSRPSVEKMENVYIHEIINEVIDILRVQPLMNDIHVTTLFEAEDDRVFADPNRLRQVFLNLMMNACDAISTGENKENGKIVIKTKIIVNSGQPDMMKIEFIDNGPGILSDNLVSIFDPFYTTKEPGKGTGLGLSVSFMIVEQIGGTIKVEDPGGAGTNMVVCLPYGKKHHEKRK